MTGAPSQRDPNARTGPDARRTAPAVTVDLAVSSRGVRITAPLRPGRITAVLGPNGAGKSTLLGAIAGTVPARGSVTVGGRDLQGLPLHERRVTHLGQDPTVFDHLSVLANAAYGPRATGASRARAEDRGRTMLREVGLEGFERRRARKLSGGQAQRLAIARALATDPEVLLLDEPFAALDVTGRSRLRALVQRLLAGRTVLLVTHDLVDVLALSDDVLVLEEGRLVQHGPREEVLSAPATAFLAELTGRVLLNGRTRDGRLTTDGGLVLPAPTDGSVAGERRILLDPRQVRLTADGPGEELPVTAVDPVGAQLLVRLGEIAALVDPEQAEQLGLLDTGATVRALVPPEALHVYAGTDERDSQH